MEVVGQRGIQGQAPAHGIVGGKAAQQLGHLAGLELIWRRGGHRVRGRSGEEGRGGEGEPSPSSSSPPDAVHQVVPTRRQPRPVRRSHVPPQHTRSLQPPGLCGGTDPRVRDPPPAPAPPRAPRESGRFSPQNKRAPEVRLCRPGPGWATDHGGSPEARAAAATELRLTSSLAGQSPEQQVPPCHPKERGATGREQRRPGKLGQAPLRRDGAGALQTPRPQPVTVT